MPDEKRKILIVDDDKDLVEAISEILTEEGFETCCSFDGTDILQLIADKLPDLVLLDCYLPRKPGIDILREIRKENDSVGVIMMTGHGEEQLVVSIMKAGASDYLKKPVNKITLLNAVKDILRKKDISREIIQSERLLLLGELFPFIAHEIRNPLHAIGGALTIIKKRVPTDPLVDKSITVIDEEIKRLNNFIKECLDFSNPFDPSKFVPTDINDVITSSLDLLEPAMKASAKQINFSLSLQEDLPKAITNFNEIKQVTVNIIKNAIEAIDREGSIEIKTSYHPEMDRDCLNIEFTDNGRGIKNEIAKKIFDPFFTTKSGAGGMGLGLTVCRKIICENHSGTLTIQSSENEGTGVMIKLPLQYHPKSTQEHNH
jgi:signal transduction histidine kinase